MVEIQHKIRLRNLEISTGFPRDSIAYPETHRNRLGKQVVEEFIEDAASKGVLAVFYEIA
jgi:hypothetical protein